MPQTRRGAAENLPISTAGACLIASCTLSIHHKTNEFEVGR